MGIWVERFTVCVLHMWMRVARWLGPLYHRVIETRRTFDVLRPVFIHRKSFAHGLKLSRFSPLVPSLHSFAHYSHNPCSCVESLCRVCRVRAYTEFDSQSGVRAYTKLDKSQAVCIQL